MAYHDFIEREIEGLSRAIAKTVLQKDLPSEQIVTEDGDLSSDEFLKYMLSRLIADGAIGSAEDLLFDWIDESPRAEYLPLACWFYERINKFSDEELLRFHFPRDEIADGLAKVKKIYSAA